MISIEPTKKPIYCKSCFKEIHLKPYRALLEREPLLCDECLNQLETELSVRKIDGVECLFLSNYGGIMKTWLMHYKEYRDYELAPVFLATYLPFVKLFSLGYTFVPLPSSPKRVKARGFDHLPEMLEASHLPYALLFSRSSETEQKNLGGAERFRKKGIALTKEARNYSGKKLLLFDDVLTTGATFRECLEVLAPIEPKKVRGLFLMDNGESAENTIHGTLFSNTN